MGFELSTLEVKLFLIDTLALEGVSPADIPDDMPLFQDGLELDSIDVLELGMAMRQRYRIQFGPENSFKESLKTVKSMTDFMNGSGV